MAKLKYITLRMTDGSTIAINLAAVQYAQLHVDYDTADWGQLGIHLQNNSRIVIDNGDISETQKERLCEALQINLNSEDE